MADETDRAISDTELRAAALIESAKGLVLINGGGAAALTTFLATTWDAEAAYLMRPFILYGISALLFGVAFASVLPWFRYRTSLDKPRSYTIGCSPWWRAHRNFTVLSVLSFIVGMALAVYGAFRTL